MELRHLTLNAHLGWVDMHAYNFFLFVDHSSPSFFFVQRERDCKLMHFPLFSTCQCVPKIFAIKVESSQKSRLISEVFSLPNFKGRAFQKLYPHYHHCLASRRLEKFCEDAPTSPEVTGTHTLNFAKL